VLLLLFSLLVGYPSSLGWSTMWGIHINPYLSVLSFFGFFAAVAAFLAAVVIFLSIAIAALTSVPAPLASEPAPSAQARLGSNQGLELTASESRVPLLVLRCLLFGIIARDFYQVLAQTGWRSNSNSRNLFLFCLIDQLPFVVALQRTWKKPNPAGLALILAASIEQILFVLVFSRDLNRELLNFWGDVALVLNLAAIGCVSSVWLRSPRLCARFSVITSIFLALATYTVVSHSLLALLGRL
jgi:hypothetical protein